MPFQGETAGYTPLRRIIENPHIDDLIKGWHIQKREPLEDVFDFNTYCQGKQTSSTNVPDLIVAIDGSRLESNVENGFPCATVGYVTIASVLLDMSKMREVESSDFIDPIAVRQTETVSSIEAVFPGANIIAEGEKNAKSTYRRVLFNVLNTCQIFHNCESLLQTYEHLFRLKRRDGDNNLPLSPIDECEEKMIYDYGEYICPYSGEPLFSTDALRLHELMNESSSNVDLFTQTMATLEYYGLSISYAHLNRNNG